MRVCVVRTCCNTVAVLPAPFNWFPEGVCEWQKVHTLDQSAAPLAEVGVTLTLPDATLVNPAMLVAVTLHVYDWPLVSPVTTTGDALPVALPDGVHVAVYCVIGLPPLEDGAVKLIFAD